MFYYVLNGDVERDVIEYGQRHCPSHFVVFRGPHNDVVVGFLDEDRALLFLNLFDDEIVGSFETAARVTAA